jgi:hypothetical protein
MNYIIEMGSGAMIYILCFVNIGSGIQKLLTGNTHTHRLQGDIIILLYFFKIREVD